MKSNRPQWLMDPMGLVTSLTVAALVFVVCILVLHAAFGG